MKRTGEAGQMSRTSQTSHMDLIVIGGGCYGCLHARQLLKAARRGKIAPRHIVVVDRNPACQALREFAEEPLVEVVRAEWGAYLRERLAATPAATEDHLVPAPLAPHLLFDWLLAEAAALPGVSATRAACALPLDLPVSQPDGRGNQIISAANWLCPVTCIEPALCPAIRGPRGWDLATIVRGAMAQAPDAYTGASLFTCRHFAWGVGTIPLADLAHAREQLRAALQAGQAQRVVIGTVSHCHGILALLDARPEDSPEVARPTVVRGV